MLPVMVSWPCQASVPAAIGQYECVARRRNMSRVGTLEHVSSLSWRRAMLEDLEEVADADGQQLERRRRSSSLQQYTRRGSRYQSHEEEGALLTAGSSGVSRAGSRTSSNSSRLHAVRQFEASLADPLASEGMPADQSLAAPQPAEEASPNLEAEHDWESLILGTQAAPTAAAEQGWQATSVPLSTVEGDPLSQPQVHQPGSASQQERALTKPDPHAQDDGPTHAGPVHHVTFATDEAEILPTPEGTQAVDETPAAAHQEPDDATGTSEDTPLLSQCLNGR